MTGSEKSYILVGFKNKSFGNSVSKCYIKETNFAKKNVLSTIIFNPSGQAARSYRNAVSENGSNMTERIFRLKLARRQWAPEAAARLMPPTVAATE